MRRYLEEEAKISALESTTDELLLKLEALKQSGQLELERETIKNLKTVLQTADLVKFARSTPEFGTTAKDRELVEGVVIEAKEPFRNPPQRRLEKERNTVFYWPKKEEKNNCSGALPLLGYYYFKFECGYLRIRILPS